MDTPGAHRPLRDDEIFRSLSGAGFMMPAPVVVHADRIPPDAAAAMQGAWSQRWYRPRPERIAVLEDVMVVQEGLVVTRQGAIIASTVTQHSAAEQEAGRQAAARAWDDAATPRLAGPAVLCRKRGVMNYGHFIVEMLPMAWLARAFWPGPLQALVHRVPGPLGQVMMDALGEAGFQPGEVAIHGAEPVRVDRLLLVDGLSEHGGYMSPMVMEALDAITARIVPRGPARLLVLRAAGQTRQLEDQAGVVAAARAQGFTPIIPENLGWREQVEAFRAAREVVGVMGAGLANLAFAPQGALATLVAPAAMPDTFFWFIAGLRGLASIEIRCPSTPGSAPAWNGAVCLGDDASRIFRPDWKALAPPAPPVFREAMRLLDRCFDEGFYRAQNPDVGQSELDPASHYILRGWREGQDPAPHVSTGRSIALFPEAEAAGVCPLVHAILAGHTDLEHKLVP